MNKNIHSFFGGKNMIEEKELNMIKNIYKKGKLYCKYNNLQKYNKLKNQDNS